jgi:hypothetical protein
MDVSLFISELLEQHGEINVPGLGYFVQSYTPGYYNEAEGKFYPPQHSVQYDPQQLDGDNTLAEYIATKKNISIASAKYFTEKYINTIKEDAIVKDVAIANLGWLYTDQGKLSFKSAAQAANDPAFFGYAPVNISKIGNIPPPVFEANTNDESVVSETNTTAVLPIVPTDTEPSITQQPAEEEVYEDAESDRSYGWMILTVVIVVAVLSVLGMYQFYPDQFESAKAWITRSQTPPKPKIEEKKEVKAVIPPKVDTLAADTVKTTAVETPVATTAAPKDTIKQKPIISKQVKPADIPVNLPAPAEYDPKKAWVVIAITCYTEAKAAAVLSDLKTKGLEPFIVPNMGGAGIYIAAGAYSSNAEADAARVKFIAAKQIPQDAYLTHIKPKK